MSQITKQHDVCRSISFRVLLLSELPCTALSIRLFQPIFSFLFLVNFLFGFVKLATGHFCTFSFQFLTAR